MAFYGFFFLNPSNNCKQGTQSLVRICCIIQSKKGADTLLCKPNDQVVTFGWCLPSAKFCKYFMDLNHP